MGQSSVRSTNGALVATVAAVAVIAVVAGGAVAARRGPTALTGGEAIPLSGAASAPDSAESLPTVPSTAAPGTTVVDLAALPEGRAPQLGYLRGRELLGAGAPIRIPGKQNITAAVRFAGTAMVILEVGQGGAELVKVALDGSGFEPDRVPDVQSMKTTRYGTMLAFATVPKNADHTNARGSAVYWEPAHQPENRRVLNRPNDFGSKVLAVVGSTVYFKSDKDRDGQRSALYRWQSDTGDVTEIKGVRSPEAVNNAGTVVADFVNGADQTFCTAVIEMRKSSRQWQTCELAVNSFTPDDRLVLASPGFRNGGADPSLTVVDAASGAIVRQWTGAGFVQAVAEDDEHVLVAADSGEGTAGAIIRCAISTGACERATELSKHEPVRTLALRLIDAA